METTPSNTLYINNINEKIKKNALKKMLYMVFSQYGRVIQIIACKGLKMRGQAWVIYDNVNAAANALKGKQGFNFYDKPLRIQFAKSKSHIIARKEGIEIVRAPKRSREERDSGDQGVGVGGGGSLDHHYAPPAKEARLVVNHTPHRILFAQHLPAEVTSDTLQAIFAAVPGFQEVRLPPGNRGLAFIEFENEIQSSMALRQFNGLQLSPTTTLHLTFSQ
eukprot:gene6153-6780_t